MFHNDGYALLIGVDDYSTFDASRSQAVGTSDLRGSLNDVRTFWRLLRLIGMKPAHIRVLASPAIDISELDGATPENVAPATEAQILEKAAWLAGKLGQASKPTGIVTYSGHGDWLARHGFVLCPSDVTWAPDADGEANLDHAVSFHALNAHLAAHAENLTVFLDTCHSGMEGGPRGRASNSKGLTLTQRPLSGMPGVRDKVKPPHIVDLAGRVLSAARRDQVAYQSMFEGRYRGVFSWAVCAAVEQWKATQEGRNVRLDLSYGNLVETATRIMGSLWFTQSPQLHGPAGVADLAVLQQGVIAQPTAAKPDGGPLPEEVDPGGKDYLVYTLTDDNGTLLGHVIVTRTAGLGYLANYEYWYMKSNLSNSSDVNVQGLTPQYWTTRPPNYGACSFKMASVPGPSSWTLGASTGTMLTYSVPSLGELQAMDWQMSNVTGAWTGHITWWHDSTSSNMWGANTSTSLSPDSTSYTAYYYTATPS